MITIGLSRIRFNKTEIADNKFNFRPQKIKLSQIIELVRNQVQNYSINNKTLKQYNLNTQTAKFYCIRTKNTEKKTEKKKI